MSSSKAPKIVKVLFESKDEPKQYLVGNDDEPAVYLVGADGDRPLLTHRGSVQNHMPYTEWVEPTSPPADLLDRVRQQVGG